MVAVAPFNFGTSVAAGSFTVTNDGLIAGTMFDDPAVRFAIRSGYVLNTETFPMWGGVAIFEDIPLPFSLTSPVPDGSMQCGIGRATSITGGAAPITAISVFNQVHNAVTSPTSPVPMAGSLQTFNYVRLGSGARVAVAIDPSLVSLDGGLVTQQVSWDFGLQRLVPYVAAYPANALTALSWGTAGGGQATGTTTTAHGIVAGDDFTISGAAPAGYNGTFTALTGTTGSTLIWSLPTNPGVETTLGTLVAGGGAFPCRILRIFTTNCMTVNYSPSTQLGTWNRNGAAAVVQV